MCRKGLAQEHNEHEYDFVGGLIIEKLGSIERLTPMTPPPEGQMAQVKAGAS